MYAYHIKADEHLSLYFRAIPGEEGEAPPGVILSTRGRKEDAWARRFPAFLRVTSQAQLPSIATFLLGTPLELGTRQRLNIASREPVTPPEEVDLDRELFEGALVRISVNRYERDSAARAACIRHYGSKCVACGFDFAATYGAWLEGFIHVHHLTPLASIGDRYRVDPLRDLRPICANCHAVAHRRNPPHTIEELRDLLAAPASRKRRRTMQ
ncbi:MAG: HNH endonuclease [Vicinamibacteria bacterium]|nr:HNH endonuclease [Vicinamibacteria bacterium]